MTASCVVRFVYCHFRHIKISNNRVQELKSSIFHVRPVTRKLTVLMIQYPACPIDENESSETNQ